MNDVHNYLSNCRLKLGFYIYLVILLSRTLSYGTSCNVCMKLVDGNVCRSCPGASVGV